jgi:Xaa-Pro aminopeptidase
MIRLDPPALVAARSRRFGQVAGDAGVDGWLLTTALAVRVVTGAWSDDVDLSSEWSSPIVAVGSSVLSPGLPPNDPRLIDMVVDLLPRTGKVAVDRLGADAYDRLHALRPDLVIEDVAPLLVASNAPRDAVEIDVITEGHRRTEAALAAMLHEVRAGVTERELSRSFYGHAEQHGIDRIHVDTVFSVLPRDTDDAPWARGEWSERSPYRELTTDKVLRQGDHVAFDAGAAYSGYAVDVGWTLLASDQDPSADEVALADEWEEVARRVIDAATPGASAADLRRAALKGWDQNRPPPWPYPFYVAHGLGVRPAELPFAGTDFGLEAEESMILSSGQVMMIEPYIWRAGVGGYRAEYCIVIEEAGARIISSLPYGQWPARG